MSEREEQFKRVEIAISALIGIAIVYFAFIDKTSLFTFLFLLGFVIAIVIVFYFMPKRKSGSMIKEKKPKEEPYEALSRSEVFGIFIFVLIIQMALDLFPFPSQANWREFIIRYTKIFLFTSLAFIIVWKFFLKVSHTNIFKKIFQTRISCYLILFLLLCLILLIILILLF